MHPLMVDSHLANGDMTFIIILSPSVVRVHTNAAGYVHVCAHRPHKSLIIAKKYVIFITCRILILLAASSFLPLDGVFR